MSHPACARRLECRNSPGAENCKLDASGPHSPLPDPSFSAELLAASLLSRLSRMQARESVRVSLYVLIFALTWPGCAASGDPVATGTPTIEQMRELWVDVAGAPRDLREGPSPDSRKPEEGGRYDVLA